MRIKSWNNKSEMELISPNQDLLSYSHHLIHGLAINNNEDETRVSLEFRLHLNDVDILFKILKNF